MKAEEGLELMLGSPVQPLERLRQHVSRYIPLNDSVGGRGFRCTGVGQFQE